MRGGSWANPAANARAAYRTRNLPSNRNENVGFRLVLPSPVQTDPIRDHDPTLTRTVQARLLRATKASPRAAVVPITPARPQTPACRSRARAGPSP